MEELHKKYLKEEGMSIYSIDQGGNEHYSEDYVGWLEENFIKTMDGNKCKYCNTNCSDVCGDCVTSIVSDVVGSIDPSKY